MIYENKYQRQIMKLRKAQKRTTEKEYELSYYAKAQKKYNKQIKRLIQNKDYETLYLYY